MDWKQKIFEIQATGLSQTQVAERLNRSQAWVSAAASGKYLDVRWADGQAILKLHAEVCSSAQPSEPDAEPAPAHLQQAA